MFNVKIDGKWMPKEEADKINAAKYSKKPSIITSLYEKTKTSKFIKDKKSLKNPFAGRSPQLTESAAKAVGTARFFKRGIFGR